MKAHDRLVEQLIDAAQRGEDLIPILRAGREHLTACATCRETAAQLVGDVLFEELTQLEDVGQLAEPPAYPTFDFAFLDPAPTPQVWHTTSRTTAATSRTIRALVEDIKLRVSVYKRTMKVALEDVSGRLSPSIVPAATTVRSTRRGERAGTSQKLPLPDADEQVVITLAARPTSGGKVDLSVDIRDTAVGRPPERAQFKLRSSSGDAGEDQQTHNGQVTFMSLDPEQYILEIAATEGRQVERVWLLTLDVQSR